MRRKEPLAFLLRPQTLSDYVGQDHLLGEEGLLNLMLQQGKLFSFILFGPPGSGKTSLAHILANMFDARWLELSALTITVQDIRKIAEEANNPLLNMGKSTVVFMDEIHRLNKMQQDALLPYVEEGRFILIGATTENPYFSINKALLSRCSIFTTQPLQVQEIAKILLKAWNFLLTEYEGETTLKEFNEKALLLLSKNCSGDLRFALNVLETSFWQATSLEKQKLDIDIIQHNFSSALLHFDSQGEEHYDTISALIKSMRGSDAQASLYYLARALVGGERPEFLARRILICASEDVGLANPQILPFCQAVLSSVKEIGMPEARILLGQAVLMIATSPKSNSSYLAINSAIEYVKQNPNPPIPYHLRNAPLEELKNLNYGVGYQYPHDFENAIVECDYLPEELKNLSFWTPKKLGYEGKLNPQANKNKTK